jgi:hypothetical protein
MDLSQLAIFDRLQVSSPASISAPPGQHTWTKDPGLSALAKEAIIHEFAYHLSKKEVLFFGFVGGPYHLKWAVENRMGRNYTNEWSTSSFVICAVDFIELTVALRGLEFIKGCDVHIS